MSLCGSCADVCSSALLISAILGCGRTEPPLNPLSEFAVPALSPFETKLLWFPGFDLETWKNTPPRPSASDGSADSAPSANSPAKNRPQAAAAIIAALSVDIDRKSTRLNSSHLGISYAVFCL